MRAPRVRDPVWSSIARSEPERFPLDVLLDFVLSGPHDSVRLQVDQARIDLSLFDLEKDPYELHNVYHDPAYAEVVAELTAELFVNVDAPDGELRVELLDGEAIAVARSEPVTRQPASARSPASAAIPGTGSAW